MCVFGNRRSHVQTVPGNAAAIPQGCGLHVRLESSEQKRRPARWDWRVNKIVRQSRGSLNSADREFSGISNRYSLMEIPLNSRSAVSTSSRRSMLLAALVDANTSDRQEVVATDRDLTGKPHRSSVSAPVEIVSASCRGAQYLVHGLYQRECDAARGELRRQRGARREWGQLQILCGGGDAGGRPPIRGDRCRALAVAAALGASVPTLADWFDRVYGVREATLVETCQRLTYNSDGPYQATGTPKSLDHKFITEDFRPA
jgi:hypothetical protein